MPVWVGGVRTWIPWTHGRLQWATGYGAGIESPGWYEQLWRFRHQAVAHWMARVARLLREQDLDVSSAQVIESLRLFETLAALRDRPVPRLPELIESIQSVLLLADTAPLWLIQDQLVVGETLESVPEEAPLIPLQKDLAAWQKRWRLKPDVAQRTFDLDLRQETDRERSILLHRLRVLGVSWGHPQRTYGKSRTFHEAWTMQWQPELTLAVISAGVWDHTIEKAANTCASHSASQAKSLPELTALLETTLKAVLQEAVPVLMQRLQAESAVTADLTHLMGAISALARLQRYRDVRSTDQSLVGGIIGGLLTRIAIGLPRACSSLDDRAAATMRQHIGEPKLPSIYWKTRSGPKHGRKRCSA